MLSRSASASRSGLFLRPGSGTGGRHSRTASAAGMNGVAAQGGLASLNGKIRMPRMPLPRHRQTDSQQIRDVEMFELEGLISEGEDYREDEEEEDAGSLGGRERGRERVVAKD